MSGNVTANVRGPQYSFKFCYAFSRAFSDAGGNEYCKLDFIVIYGFWEFHALANVGFQIKYRLSWAQNDGQDRLFDILLG